MKNKNQDEAQQINRKTSTIFYDAKNLKKEERKIRNSSNTNAK